jgi:hypothetical protein
MFNSDTKAQNITTTKKLILDPNTGASSQWSNNKLLFS